MKGDLLTVLMKNLTTILSINYYENGNKDANPCCSIGSMAIAPIKTKNGVHNVITQQGKDGKWTNKLIDAT